MSPSATHAMRNEATRRWKPPKATPFAELTIGTVIRPSHGRPRTVADDCERLGNVERTHPQPPDPQSETETLATHSGKTFLYIIHPFFMEVSYNGNGGTPNHPNSDHFSIEIHDTSPQMMGGSVPPIQT